MRRIITSLVALGFAGVVLSLAMAQPPGGPGQARQGRRRARRSSIA